MISPSIEPPLAAAARAAAAHIDATPAFMSDDPRP
jgi:hypothetical protein